MGLPTQDAMNISKMTKKKTSEQGQAFIKTNRLTWIGKLLGEQGMPSSIEESIGEWSKILKVDAVLLDQGVPERRDRVLIG
ncbi:hypothetical protein Y032_0003g1230 [Ancylostoma ceylanicum]|uniref:Uncharacterized protein n=1 Tax=Ancylostoma ceylanicum TaxID=53326 RepID=A0A016VVY6_9BILA|nr:hypothetical protein Y032_0003g1230 [Ancylostoma ceylanicum]